MYTALLKFLLWLNQSAMQSQITLCACACWSGAMLLAKALRFVFAEHRSNDWRGYKEVINPYLSLIWNSHTFQGYLTEVFSENNVDWFTWIYTWKLTKWNTQFEKTLILLYVIYDNDSKQYRPRLICTYMQHSPGFHCLPFFLDHLANNWRI